MCLRVSQERDGDEIIIREYLARSALLCKEDNPNSRDVGKYSTNHSVAANDFSQLTGEFYTTHSII